MGENWTFDAENLTVGYDGKTVIADVNFSVGAGERILLCGANGLGKSTLLRTLALLQPPVSGKCSFSASSEKRRTVLIPARIPKVQGFSVEHFVAASCYLETDWLGRIPARLKNQIKTAVENVGIPELLHRDISTLSDGEFQKVCIAAAVARNAEVVLLDEPTAFLDVEARETVLQTLSDIVRCENAPAIIFSSHDIHSAVRHCTRIFGLYKNTDRETSFMDSGPCVSEFDAVLERCFPNIPIRRQL